MKIRLLTVGLLFGMGFGPVAHAAQVTHDGRYVYMRASLSELVDPEQRKIVREMVEFAHDRFKEMLPQGRLTQKALDVLRDDNHRVKQVLNELREYSEKVDVEPFGLRVYDLVPNTIVVTVSARVSANKLVGGSGSVHLGLALMPFHVTRVDMLTGEVSRFVEVDWSVLLMPNLGVGVGAGGGVTGKVSVGLVFGRMKRAADFNGVSVSVSGNVQSIGGVYVKGGVVSNLKKKGVFDFLYVMAGPGLGADVDATVHMNASYIFGPGSVLKWAMKELGIKSPPSGTQEIPLH